MVLISFFSVRVSIRICAQSGDAATASATATATAPENCRDLVDVGLLLLDVLDDIKNATGVMSAREIAREVVVHVKELR